MGFARKPPPGLGFSRRRSCGTTPLDALPPLAREGSLAVAMELNTKLQEQLGNALEQVPPEAILLLIVFLGSDPKAFGDGSFCRLSLST